MADVLDLVLPENDSGETTVRGYLKALLKTLWTEDESFSGKRPFGNSGWKLDFAPLLIKEGFVKGTLSGEGDVLEYDDAQADALILDAIDRL